MIKTITLDAAIEKRIYGKGDGVQYEMDHTVVNSGGCGIVISRILKMLGVESESLILTSHGIADFIKTTMLDKKIPSWIVEHKEEANEYFYFFEEGNGCYIKKQMVPLQDHQLQLFATCMEEHIQKNDIVVLSYQEQDVSEKTMSQLFDGIKENTKVLYLHPKYWPLLKKQPAAILLIDKEQCLSWLKKEQMPLSEMMEKIKEEIVLFSTIVICALACNDFLFFVEDKQYRVIGGGNKNGHIHVEAILSGIAKCFVQDGNLKNLGEECLSMSIGSAIHQSFDSLEPKSLAILKNNVIMYEI